jgi:hypothetical protein
LGSVYRACPRNIQCTGLEKLFAICQLGGARTLAGQPPNDVFGGQAVFRGQGQVHIDKHLAAQIVQGADASGYGLRVAEPGG